jgi:hypothetical protein
LPLELLCSWILISFLGLPWAVRCPCEKRASKVEIKYRAYVSQIWNRQRRWRYSAWWMLAVAWIRAS